MPRSFLNNCRWRAASSGAADFVFASALSGADAPASCTNPSVDDGGTYAYFAGSDDGTQREYGEGVWDSGTGTLTRATIFFSTNGGLAVAFSAAPRVAMGCELADGTTAVLAAIALKADKATTITGTKSIDGGGDLSSNRTVELVNDEASPGNNQVYGTDGSGTKGWQSAGGGGSNDMTAAVQHMAFGGV